MLLAIQPVLLAIQPAILPTISKPVELGLENEIDFLYN